MSEQETYEGSGRVGVAIWSTSRGGPQHRIRLTEQASPEEVEEVIRRVLAAHRLLAAELAGKAERPFKGEEPGVAP